MCTGTVAAANAGDTVHLGKDTTGKASGDGNESCVDPPACGKSCGLWSSGRVFVWVVAGLQWGLLLGILFVLFRGGLRRVTGRVVKVLVLLAGLAAISSMVLTTLATFIRPKLATDFAYLENVETSATAAPVQFSFGTDFDLNIAVIVVEFGFGIGFYCLAKWVGENMVAQSIV
ncbi:hypothetical protein HDU76_009723 [Blyttiomyces sp. JEL0837]|nr:hypothetical protein HDU76_009723 [Blyttiomyces sp. JEL0837]